VRHRCKLDDHITQFGFFAFSAWCVRRALQLFLNNGVAVSRWVVRLCLCLCLWLASPRPLLLLIALCIWLHRHYYRNFSSLCSQASPPFDSCRTLTPLSFDAQRHAHAPTDRSSAFLSRRRDVLSITRNLNKERKVIVKAVSPSLGSRRKRGVC